jgi:hypothetical protein
VVVIIFGFGRDGSAAGIGAARAQGGNHRQDEGDNDVIAGH